MGHSFFPTRSRSHRGHQDAGIACRKSPTAKPARALLNTNRSFIALHYSGKHSPDHAFTLSAFHGRCVVVQGKTLRAFQVNRPVTPHT